LEYVEEKDQSDHAHQGDVAFLVGQYMIIAEPVQEEGTDALIMSNYLKVGPVPSIRWQNFTDA
jgi:hypothetical protein